MGGAFQSTARVGRDRGNEEDRHGGLCGSGGAQLPAPQAAPSCTNPTPGWSGAPRRGTRAPAPCAHPHPHTPTAATLLPLAVSPGAGRHCRRVFRPPPFPPPPLCPPPPPHSPRPCAPLPPSSLAATAVATRPRGVPTRRRGRAYPGGTAAAAASSPLRGRRRPPPPGVGPQAVLTRNTYGGGGVAQRGGGQGWGRGAAKGCGGGGPQTGRRPTVTPPPPTSRVGRGGDADTPPPAARTVCRGGAAIFFLGSPPPPRLVSPLGAAVARLVPNTVQRWNWGFKKQGARGCVTRSPARKSRCQRACQHRRGGGQPLGHSSTACQRGFGLGAFSRAGHTAWWTWTGPRPRPPYKRSVVGCTHHPWWCRRPWRAARGGRPRWARCAHGSRVLPSIADHYRRAQTVEWVVQLQRADSRWRATIAWGTPRPPRPLAPRETALTPSSCGQGGGGEGVGDETVGVAVGVVMGAAVTASCGRRRCFPSRHTVLLCCLHTGHTYCTIRTVLYVCTVHMYICMHTWSTATPTRRYMPLVIDEWVYCRTGVACADLQGRRRRLINSYTYLRMSVNYTLCPFCDVLELQYGKHQP